VRPPLLPSHRHILAHDQMRLHLRKAKALRGITRRRRGGKEEKTVWKLVCLALPPPSRATASPDWPAHCGWISADRPGLRLPGHSAPLGTFRVALPCSLRAGQTKHRRVAIGGRGLDQAVSPTISSSWHLDSACLQIVATVIGM
jgi:hypothetical protein